MSNTMTSLFPALVASRFAELNFGQWSAVKFANTDFSADAMSAGQSVTVTVGQASDATDFALTGEITVENYAPSNAVVSLSKEPAVSFALTLAEISKAQKNISVVDRVAETIGRGIVKFADNLVVSELANITASATYDISDESTINGKTIKKAKGVLDKAGAPEGNRYVLLGADWYNDLMGSDDYKSLILAGSQDVNVAGVIPQRFGFNYGMSLNLTSTGYACQKDVVALVARPYDTLSENTINVSLAYVNGIPIQIIMAFDVYTKSYIISGQTLMGSKIIDITKGVKITAVA
jgi:hypothetical protein